MTQAHEDPQNAPQSASYQKARNKAAQYAEDPQKLEALIHEASDKASQQKGALQDVWDSLTTLFRLLGAYRRGEYRDLPWQSLSMIIAAILYFLMPVDLIPDAILGIGLLDDSVIIAWTVRLLKTDIDRFLAWEQATPPEPSEDEETT